MVREISSIKQISIYNKKTSPALYLVVTSDEKRQLIKEALLYSANTRQSDLKDRSIKRQ